MSATQQVLLDHLLRCGVCGDTLSEVYAGTNVNARGKKATARPARNNKEVEIKFYLMECGHFACRKHLDIGKLAFIRILDFVRQP